MTLSKAETITNDLMKHHGLVNWAVEFREDKSYLGACYLYEKTIVLNKAYILKEDSEENVLDTILHEIAHALVGNNFVYENGNRIDHGMAWRFKAASIGLPEALDYPGEEKLENVLS